MDISAEFLKAIGKNLKRLRIARKLSMEKLGLEVGLTRMQVSRIESGYNITAKTILKLSLALNCKPEALLRFNYKPKREDLEGLVESSKGNRRRSRK